MTKSIKSLLKLAFPIILGQLGQMLIGAGDVLVAGRFSTHAVAAIGVANGLVNPIFLFGLGLMFGVSPFLAYHRGKGDIKGNQVKTVLTYSFLVGIFVSLTTKLLLPLMNQVDLDPEIVQSTKNYIEVVLWSFPFAIMFQALKEYLQSKEKVMLPNMIALFSVILNIGLNFFFVFGLANYNGMGEIGLAYASLSIRIIMFLILFVYMIKSYDFGTLMPQMISKLFVFNLPVGFLFFIEVLAFCTVAVLSGRLGVTEAATNNIIMTLASISFMIPLSLSSALSVKIGHHYGEEKIQAVKNDIKSGVIVGLVYITFAVSCFLLFPQTLLSWMTKDTKVILLGTQLLVIVALFQVSDVLQVILTGMLRGLGITKVPFLLVFFGYWLIGIPSGIYFTFYTDVGVKGLWWGLAISLSIVAIALTILTAYRYKKFS